MLLTWCLLVVLCLCLVFDDRWLLVVVICLMLYDCWVGLVLFDCGGFVWCLLLELCRIGCGVLWLGLQVNDWLCYC